MKKHPRSYFFSLFVSLCLSFSLFLSLSLILSLTLSLSLSLSHSLFFFLYFSFFSFLSLSSLSVSFLFFCFCPTGFHWKRRSLRAAWGHYQRLPGDFIRQARLTPRGRLLYGWKYWWSQGNSSKNGNCLSPYCFSFIIYFFSWCFLCYFFFFFLKIRNFMTFRCSFSFFFCERPIIWLFSLGISIILRIIYTERIY